MNFAKLKELKAYLENNDFYTNYFGVQRGAYIFSFIAQAAIIFFGFYFIREMIKTAEPDLNPYVIDGIAFVFLFGFETLKRNITDKWAQDFVDNGAGVKVGFMTLTVASLVLYAGSFFFTLNGAGKWSDRSDKIAEQSVTTVASVKDSLNNKYEVRINNIKTERQNLENQNNTNSAVVSYNTAVKKFTERGWKVDKDLVESLKPSYDQVENRFHDNVSKLDNQITRIEQERDTEITKAEKRLETQTNKTTTDSKYAQSSFIKWSIAFEFVVIFGIYFRRYFQWKSVKDWDDRIKSDPKLNRWHRYDRLLDVLFQTKIKTLDPGAPLPKAKELSQMAHLESLLFTESEINSEFYRLLNQLGVIVTRGSKRYIQLSYTEAKKSLGKQFDVA